jgi:hypothetical protein
MVCPSVAYLCLSRFDVRRAESLTYNSLDAALSAQAKFKSYREPDASVVKQFQTWVDGSAGTGNFNPLQEGLEMPYQGDVYTKELASIATAEKSWVHQFVDKHNSLRKIFVSGYGPHHLTVPSRA